MADFAQALDPSKLVLVEAVSSLISMTAKGSAILQGLSFITSAFTAPVYNLPLFLFGMYAQENTEAVQSLQAVSHLARVSC